MNRPLSNFQMRDAEALLHPYTDAVALRETGALVIERGEGVRVFDQAGRGYIDGLAGLWCCGLGFGNEELVEAARAQMSKLPYYHLFAGRSLPRRSRSWRRGGWRGCSTSRAGRRRTRPR
jgi:4-aminobutyrate--pyruvate transaminase